MAVELNWNALKFVSEVLKANKEIAKIALN